MGRGWERSRVSLVHSQQKRKGLVFPFVIIPPLLSSLHTHTHTHTPRKASLARRIWTVPGSLPKCHQNLVYIFNEEYEFIVPTVCMFHLIKSHKHKEALVSSYKCVCSLPEHLTRWQIVLQEQTRTAQEWFSLSSHNPEWFLKVSFPSMSSSRSQVLYSELSWHSPDSLEHRSSTSFFFHCFLSKSFDTPKYP